MTLYKGRISAKGGGLMDEINRSLPVDIRLLPYDLLTNRAWAGQLLMLRIYTSDEHDAVCAALDKIGEQYQAGAFHPLPDDEDVHTLVERLLTDMTGGAGARIHTGRSRNDQVVCDFRMYVSDRLADLADALSDLIGLLQKLGDAHAETLMAGTTHLQPAQPITLGYYLLSAGYALLRDLGRVFDAESRVNLCPLGAGAIAGSGFEVDRVALASELGFDGICENGMDAISDRDFAQEAAYVSALTCLHLSRYAEQFILWANPAFGYVRFSDEWSTGSSMMPQKRNPDAMELIRGKASRCIGNATGLAALTKGVPLSYAKDLQEDKQALFDALDTALLCVQVFSGALETATFFPEKFLAALTGDMLATDLADALVMEGVPFRSAHEQVAEFVTELEAKAGNLADVTPDEIAARFDALADDPPKLDFFQCVQRRTVEGGTAPDRVRQQANRLGAQCKKMMEEKNINRRV